MVAGEDEACFGGEAAADDQHYSVGEVQGECCAKEGAAQWIGGVHERIHSQYRIQRA